MTHGTRSQFSRGIGYLVVCLAVCRFAAAQLVSQQPGLGLGSFPASVSARLSPATAAPGDIVKIQIAVTLDIGFHTYDIVQSDMKDLATQLTVDLPDQLQAVGDCSGDHEEPTVPDAES